MVIRAKQQGMAFIALRRTRGTQSYYLVESYRDDQGRARKRTLCYLGREQDGTDSVVKALDHWQTQKDESRRQAANVTKPVKLGVSEPESLRA